MTDAERFLEFLERERPKVLNEKALAIAREIAKSPAKSRKFLQKIGTHDKNGRLTKHYR